MRPKTIFCDIDGTLLEHCGDIAKQSFGSPKVLPGALQKLREWDLKGYGIILVTGRRESVRQDLERQLREAGIFYDRLIMGIGGGVRVLINDQKPDSDAETATAITVERNRGLEDVEI
jgi:hydroxymethylpyrimidine pyrophosphatase-like HAD family hydrolase